MVILVNPMWSVENLNKDSNYVHIKKILEVFTQMFPEYYFVIPFPVKHFKYYEDGLFDNPNIERIPYQIPLAKKLNNITFNGEWYKDVVEKYSISTIYNQIPEVTGQLKCLDTHFASNINVINQHHWIHHESLPYAMQNQMQWVYWQIIGDVLADVNIYNSNYTKDMVYDNIAKYMPEFSDKVNGQVLHMGLWNDEHIDNNSQRKRFDKFTFCYNHRLQAYKNWETTFEIFDELYKKHDFNVAVCPVGTSNIEKVNKRPYTTIYDCKTEKEYYDVLKKCHANTFNSQYETFCISIFESMMLGLATIVPNTTTMPELLGKESWQLFNNTEEQKQKLSDLLTTPNMAYVCGNKNINTSRAYNIIDYCTSLENIFKGQMTKVNYYESLKDKNKDKLNNYLKKFNYINASDLKKIRRHINLSNQSVPNHRLVNIMYHAGYNQKLEKGEPVFCKKLDK